MKTLIDPSARSRSDLAALGLCRRNVTCEFKALDDSGSFELYAAVFGNLDRQGDVIEPGAFSNLDEFVTDGLGLTNHLVYTTLPVALIDSAVQDSHGLKVAGRFHSHPEAQACRTVVTERKAAGKSVKCSIGYLIDEESYEKRAGKMVRRIKRLSVYEFSFVNLPANPSAEVISAKSVTDPPPSQPAEDPMGIETLNDKGTAALTALKDWLSGLSTKSAKPMSKSGMTRLKAFAEAMDEHGQATREHAKAMSEHGKAACEMGKACKAFLKDYEPGDDDTETPEEEEGVEVVKPKKKPKSKEASPEDTADGEPPKSKSTSPAPAPAARRDSTLTVYADQLRQRALSGRRHQSCP
jgi:HK97 family phage prohead protease